ncbi:MAG TPA: phosphatase PAP2 family protein [Acidimicrobiales bacterium]|nr:phosphatase PAP2 family protein [Acidimicrobiales bacterium]
MNTSYYLDINNFARHTSWAHAFMSGYAYLGGVAFLAFLLLVAWWRARSGPWASQTVAAVVWAGIGAVVAVGLAQPINHAMAELRPYYALHGVEVLVPRAHDFSFPSDHATFAGAVMAGLWLTHRDRWLAVIGTAAALLLAFARVYAGAHYPADVLAGLVLGATVVLVIRPLTMPLLRGITKVMDQTPLWFLVESRAARRVGAGW